ncbi:FLYWCH zinc finger domain-containing protein [Phthorimaea operculella]|nr:FLYWCH zinc finger domain-containing protein [Phthorimaea operculella]
MIQFGKYHFSMHTRSKQKNSARKLWVCGKTASSGCRASIVTVDDTIMIKMGEYHFSLHGFSKQKNSAKKMWVCGKWASSRCRASVVTVDDTIVKCNNIHNH